jgi:hypothetical protein
MNAMRKLLALCILALAASAPAFAQDVIKFKDPKTPDMEGDIVSMSYKLVEIEIPVGGTMAKQPADARQIADVVPSNSKKTFDFAQGENAMANGDFASAIQRFERTAADTRGTELMRQLAAINIVRSHWYNGNPSGTVQAAQAMRAKKADGFYVRESFELEVKAHLANRNQNGAKASIDAFAAMGNANGMQEWAKSAELMTAGLAELKGDWRGALTIHKKYSRDKDVGEEATLGEMRCLTAIQNWTELNSRGDAIISDAKGKKSFNTRLLIAAYNGKGEADLNGGKSKEALLNFLQGAMVLGKGETSPEHEASLARAAIACAKLSGAEKDKPKKDTWRGRAMEMVGELQKFYGKSRYLPEIDKAIKDIK